MEMRALSAVEGAVNTPVSLTQSSPGITSREIVFDVESKLPAVAESYHCTLATKVPASSVAAIFTYTPSAYDNN
jgi:hypothetical protein